MQHIYKDGELLTASNLNNSFAELETTMQNLLKGKSYTPRYGTAWQTSNFKLTRIGNLIGIYGKIWNGDSFNGQIKSFAEIENQDFRPKEDIAFAGVSYILGLNTPYMPTAIVTIHTNGLIDVYVTRATTHVTFSGIYGV